MHFNIGHQGKRKSVLGKDTSFFYSYCRTPC